MCVYSSHIRISYLAMFYNPLIFPAQTYCAQLCKVPAWSGQSSLFIICPCNTKVFFQVTIRTPAPAQPMQYRHSLHIEIFNLYLLGCHRTMTIGTKVYLEFYKTLHLYLYFFLSSFHYCCSPPLSVFSDMVSLSLCNNSFGCPGSHSVEQDGLELRESCLPLPL